MAKRGKVVASKKLEMTPLFSDTTCRRDGGTYMWETMYDLLEEEKPRPLVTKATSNGHASLDISIFEMACTFLHCIAMRPKLILYTDMVKWIVDQVDVSNIEFNNSRKDFMGSFSPNNLRLLYLILEPQAFYNKQFLEKFVS